MVQALHDAVGLANELRPILLRLSRQLRRESHAFGVTGGQVSLLAEVGGQPGITARELAEREQVSAPAMSGYLTALEKAGLLRRVRAADDRRRDDLFLTGEGKRVLRAVRKQRTAWLTERLEQLSVDDRTEIETAIGALGRLVEISPE